jgi:predicted secreted hydrolase
MRCRCIVLGVAALAGAPILVGITGCGRGATTPDTTPALDEPAPIPASASAIHLPADQYMHPGAPTEWWWHVGTLEAGDRTFGFEINAASFAAEGFGFTQVMLTDVTNARHYERTTPFVPPVLFDAGTWAQQDVTKEWSVQLGDASSPLSAIAVTAGGSGYTSSPTVTIAGGGGTGAAAIPLLDATTGAVSEVVVVNPGTGYTSEPTITISGGGGTGATAYAYPSYVTMSAPSGDPTEDMAVSALLDDETTQSVVSFDLTLSQQGPPFIVWGTGVKPAPGTTGTPLQTNNYYYSLTHLQASGSISIDGESFDVTGVTWMDHEYGYFGTSTSPVKWILQDMQLDDGVSISNYAVIDPTTLRLNQATASNATIQRADGITYYVPTVVTPIGRTWLSPASGSTYFLQLQVDIPGFDATLVATSLVDAQEFPVTGSSVYEGVAGATGTFEGHEVSGSAWIEQNQ